MLTTIDQARVIRSVMGHLPTGVVRSVGSHAGNRAAVRFGDRHSTLPALTPIAPITSSSDSENPAAH
jgi:hypothetical protein